MRGPGRKSFSTLRVERDEDLLRVTLDEPARANALSPTMVEELTDVYCSRLRAEGIRALLLRGAGDHFCAGADLEHLGALGEAGPEENLRDSRSMRALFESVLRQEVLTVVAVHGACVAGGCGLATAHDFVVAAQDARFLYSEARIGFVPALVASFLRFRVRGSDLRGLLLNPEPVGADRALEIGLVDRVVPGSELEGTAESLAEGILGRASSESIARTKRLLLELPGTDLAEAMDRAEQVNADSRATADCKRGIETFLETKAPPRWRE